MDRIFCEIYDSIVNARRSDRRYCKLFVGMVDVRPLDGRFCEIYDSVVDGRCLDRRYCKVFVGMVEVRPLDRRFAKYMIEWLI